MMKQRVHFMLLALLIGLTVSGGYSVTSGQEAEYGPDMSEVVDLREYHGKFEEAWDKALIMFGYRPSSIIEDQTNELQTKQYNGVTVTWIYSRSRVTLPVGAGETRLEEMRNQWRQITHSLNMGVTRDTKTKDQQKISLDLLAQMSVSIRNQRILIPVRQMTLVLPLIESGSPTLAPSALSATPAPKGARVAIIIDDVGIEREQSEILLQIKEPLTFSVMPFHSYSRELVQSARRAGFEVILHLPVETVKTKDIVIPGVIRKNFSDEQLMYELTKDIEEFPGIRGMNNHMGSFNAGDQHLMDLIMRELKRRNLFYVDSRTYPNSIAEATAHKFRVPFAKRTVFIDHYPQLEKKKEALRQLIAAAQKDGLAIGIGHTRPGTPEAIREMLPEFHKAGITIVPVSELVR